MCLCVYVCACMYAQSFVRSEFVIVPQSMLGSNFSDWFKDEGTIGIGK